MGAGASTGNPPFESEEAALAAGKTQEEIDAWKASNSSSKDDSEKAAAEDAGAAAAAEAEAAFWENLFAHRGDYSEQVEKFGDTPDYADKGNWYWCGQAGDTGPETAPEGEDATPVSERAADVFYVHPTTFYMGSTWNMPMEKVSETLGITNFYLDTEASAFNGSCRIFAPKFRQFELAAAKYPKEGKLAADLAYTDIKKAFEHYLANDNNGRPFILASHSQGSYYSLRLMLDFIEGKELFKQFVACYGVASWAPLSLFEGEKAVFKQIKVCKSATDVGCYISWTCETTETVKAHRALKESKETGDQVWYPALGHKVGDDDWRSPSGEPIVCTHPLTWVSNGLEDSKVEPEEWLGMLNPFNGATTATEPSEPQDMDTLQMLLFAPGGGGIKVKKLSKLTPAQFEEGADKFSATVCKKTGDLEIPELPTKLGGSSQGMTCEHMNYFLFWFNIRQNVGKRIKAHNEASAQ